MGALFINVGDSYQEPARLDSSWGPTLWAVDETGLVELHSAGPQACPAGGHAARLLATCRALRETPLLPAGFCPFWSGRARSPQVAGLRVMRSGRPCVS